MTTIDSVHVEVADKDRSADFRPGGKFSQFAELRHVLPEKYSSPVKSPLKAEVVPEGENVFVFELTN